MSMSMPVCAMLSGGNTSPRPGGESPPLPSSAAAPLSALPELRALPLPPKMDATAVQRATDGLNLTGTFHELTPLDLKADRVWGHTAGRLLLARIQAMHSFALLYSAKRTRRCVGGLG